MFELTCSENSPIVINRKYGQANDGASGDNLKFGYFHDRFVYAWHYCCCTFSSIRKAIRFSSSMVTRRAICKAFSKSSTLVSRRFLSAVIPLIKLIPIQSMSFLINKWNMSLPARFLLSWARADSL